MSPEQEPDHQVVAEVSIVGHCLGMAAGQGPDWTQPFLAVGDVLAQIDRALELGAKAVLLKVDSLGGDIAAGYALFAAIRDLADRGIPTVAYVSGWAASNAPFYVVACDAVVAKGQARFLLHAPRPPAGAQDVDAAFVTRATQGVALLQCRTRVPLVLASEWLGTPLPADARQEQLQVVYAKEAIELGLADFIGSSKLARATAHELGQNPRSQLPSHHRTKRKDWVWQAHFDDVMTIGRSLANEVRALHHLRSYLWQ